MFESAIGEFQLALYAPVLVGGSQAFVEINIPISLAAYAIKIQRSKKLAPGGHRALFASHLELQPGRRFILDTAGKIHFGSPNYELGFMKQQPLLLPGNSHSDLCGNVGWLI